MAEKNWRETPGVTPYDGLYGEAYDGLYGEAYTERESQK